MNTMSKEGFEPNQAIWEEPATLMHTIIASPYEDLETGQRFNVYSARKDGEGPRLSSRNCDKRELPVSNGILMCLLHSKGATC